MRGRHRIIIHNKKLHYELTIKRNITIIQGDSATGKTTLVEMLQSHDTLGENSGISVSCDVPCSVLSGKNWKEIIGVTKNTIFFTDEENAFIHTKEFASAIEGSDNYYVLITRENLYELPYSVDEIYGLHSSGRYQNTQKIYQQMYHIYPDNIKDPIKPTRIVTEDSNAGYGFFNHVCMKRGIVCNHTDGNAKIHSYIESLPGEGETCVIADGASFGPYMNKLYQYLLKKHHIHLFLPESFEWIILHSGLIDGNEVKRMLEAPEEYIESSEYFNWERFFTATLINYTKNTHYAYSKKGINDFYLTDKNEDAILKGIRGITFELTKEGLA